MWDFYWIHQIVSPISNSESTNICYDFYFNWQTGKKKLFWTIWWVCYSKNSPFLDDDATGLTAIKWTDLDGNCFAMLQKKKSGGGRRFGRQDVVEEVTEAAVADRQDLVT